MPALDPSGGRVGAYHIADQNKANPIKTLCGQALDKPTISYWSCRENFEQATCKVCRLHYFDEKWSGEIAPPIVEITHEDGAPPKMLFQMLDPPINTHGEKTDGS